MRIGRNAIRLGLACAGCLVLVLAYRLGFSPVLAHTPGEWDCACGDSFIKTTYRVIWNPLRDRAPEMAAERFLAGLRAGDCAVAPELCRAELKWKRVSGWAMAYREDHGESVSIYFKLTKVGAPESLALTGVGAVDLQKRGSEWAVTSYSSYF